MKESHMSTPDAPLPYQSELNPNGTELLSLTEHDTFPELELRDALGLAIGSTWQRRQVIERMLAHQEAAAYIRELPPNQLGLFGGDKFAQAQLIQLNSTLRNLNGKDRSIAIECQLFRILLKESQELGQFLVADLPSALFARPGDKLSLNQAKIFLEKNGELTLTQLFQAVERGLVQHDQLPFLEQIIAACIQKSTFDLGIRVLADQRKAAEYVQQWVKRQTLNQLRSIPTPTYREVRRQCLIFTRRNGLHQTVSRSIAYGPSGQGKTELYRQVNQINGKATVVITARPHLGFEELVAAPEIVSRDRAPNLSDLASRIKDVDSMTACRILYKASDVIGRRQLGQVFDLSPDQSAKMLAQIRNNWLKNICGLNPEMARWLASFASEDEIPALGKTLTPTMTTEATTNSSNIGFGDMQLGGDGHEFSLKQVQMAFVESLLTESVSLTLDQIRNRSVNYLKGLILLADEAGACVLIDEAEKLYSSQGSESFAGLEDLLTRKSGGVVEVGNIRHQISTDFFIDLTMNVKSLPPHILSRFGSRVFQIEAGQSDLLGIAAVGVANELGLPALSQEEQQKLVFFLGFVWPHLVEVARQFDEPFDLRTLSSLISSLVYKGRPNRSLASAIDEIRLPQVRLVLERYAALLPETGDQITQLMTGQDDLEIKSPSCDTSPLLTATIFCPDNVHIVSEGWITRLSDAECRRAAAAVVGKHESNGLVISSRVGELSLVGGKNGVEVIVASPYDDDILFVANLPVNSSVEDGVRLVDCDAWGRKVLLQVDGNYVVYQLNPPTNNRDELNQALMPPLRNMDQAIMSPTGTVVFGIDHQGGLNMVPLQKGKEVLRSNQADPIELKLPRSTDTVNSINFSRDGRFLLVNITDSQNSPATYVLELMMIDHQVSPRWFTKSQPIPGTGWMIDSFENVWWLVNADTYMGFRLG